jgi:hypothetical protein
MSIDAGAGIYSPALRSRPMGPILQHIRPHDVFDNATLTLLAEAYDKAIASISDDHGEPAVVRDVIARHILDLAASGERDVNILCQEALIAWGTYRKASNGSASLQSGFEYRPQRQVPRESDV